jgi:hypothetical protein
MVDQTQMNRLGNGVREMGAGESVPHRTGRNLAELLHDLLTLGELQYRLFVLDAERAMAAVRAVSLLIVVGAVLVFCCIPVGMITIALWLVEAAKLSYAAAFTWTVIGGLVLGLTLIGASVLWVRKRPPFFECTRNECAQNLDWLKTMLRRHSRSFSPSATTRSDQVRSSKQ